MSDGARSSRQGNREAVTLKNKRRFGNLHNSSLHHAFAIVPNMRHVSPKSTDPDHWLLYLWSQVFFREPKRLFSCTRLCAAETQFQVPAANMVTTNFLHILW